MCVCVCVCACVCVRACVRVCACVRAYGRTGVLKMAEMTPAMPDAPKCARGPSGTPLALRRVFACAPLTKS
eukprot:6176863-Pleurochrysis_carterae.AAC.1